MREYKFLIIFGLISLNSCSRTLTEKDAINHSHYIIGLIDSSRIGSFHTWTYCKRGQTDIWDKQKGDCILYNCIYSQTEDTIKISISNLSLFSKDFPIKIDFDSTLFCRYIFKFSKDSFICVKMIDTLGRDHILKRTYKLTQLFESRNPFQYFSDLNELKNKIGVIGIKYMPRIGDFIEFYLSPDYVLTYLPDSTSLNSKFSTIWKNEFNKGKMIEKYWNLRHINNASR
jgi:hypothetical protein